MSTGWENHESAPMEYFHGRLMDMFHEWRRATHGDNLQPPMGGNELNNIIAKAKVETYAKYPKHVSNKAIPKADM